VSRGEYGYVYLTLADRQRLARHFGISTREFTRQYCQKVEGLWCLRDFTAACRFLEGTKCQVYEARPGQCRTWPFWPEVMGAKVWSREVAAYCPGIGKGRLWTAEEIRAQLKAESENNEKR
jgi:Fe-S-cluster containining protein